MNESKSSNKGLLPKLTLKSWLAKSSISSCLLMFSFLALSQEKQLKLTPVDSLLPMLGGLIVILIFIFGLAFLFKRFTNFSPSSKNIKILETQMIGTKEKLIIVKVKQQSFLIGVTANSISQLGELNLNDQVVQDEEQIPESSKESINTPDFKSVLGNIVRNSVGLKSNSNDVNKLVG